MIQKHRLFIYFLMPFLVSCKTFTSTVMFETNGKYQFETFSHKYTDVLIKPYDQLSIVMTTNSGQILLEKFIQGSNSNTSYGKIDDGMTYMVESDSTVKIPTLGSVKIAGLTIRKAEDFLEQQFAVSYQKPFVKIEIKNRRVLLFFEEGTSAKIIDLPRENLTLIEAIAKAGGLSANSKSHKIKLLRGDPHNPKIFQYNIRSIKDLTQADLMLESNDIIYVESRPRYVGKFVAQLQPYLMLVSTSILVYTVFIKR